MSTQPAPIAADDGRWAALRAITDRRERRVLGEVSALAVVAGLADAATLVGISGLAVALTRDERSLHLAGADRSIGQVAALSALGALVRLVAGAWAAHRSAALASEVLHRHRTLVVRRFVAAPWATSSSVAGGSIQQLALQNSQVASANVLVWSTGLTAAITLAVFGATALVIQPATALAVVLVAVVVGAVMRPLSTRSRTTGAAEAAAGSHLATAVSEVVATDVVTTVFHTGVPVVDRFATISTHQAKVYRRGRLLAGLAPVAFQTVVSAGVLGALVLLDRTEVGDLSSVGAVALLALRSMSAAQGLQQAVQTCDAQRGYLSQLAAAEARLDVATSPSTTRLLDGLDRVEMRQVVVERDSDRFRLGPVDLTVEPGEAVAIGGPSGAGKSTLLEVLVGLRPPTSGSVVVDGTDLATVDPASWARHVGFVPQQPVLMAGSVADNVRWFRDLSDEQIRVACELAALGDEIASWPQGLSTPVGDGGSALSVGQRQRVCLARALVASPRLVVLDEPTAALDDAAEAQVIDALRGLRGRMGIVIAAHGERVPAVCDRVVELRDGRIV